MTASRSWVRSVLNGTAGLFIVCWGIPLTGLLCAALLLAQEANTFGSWSFDEVSRNPSPNGDVDAVLVETNGGATTSFGYGVYVLRRGEAAERGNPHVSLYGAGRSRCAYGANLRWQSPERLIVEYLDARMAEPAEQEVSIEGKTITVVLRSGIDDPIAPCGGMLYNLQRRR